jgi:hypothetical protein
VNPWTLSLGLLAAISALANDNLPARLAQGEVVVSVNRTAGASLPELTAQGVIEAPAERVWAILQNCSNYQSTMPRVLRSEELSRQDQTVVCEIEIDLPFPLSNLIGVTEATHVIGPPEWSRSWHLLRGDYKVNDGSWTLTSFEDDPMRTLAVYRVHAAPKSSIPYFILKNAQRRAIPLMFDNLRKNTATTALPPSQAG